MPFIFTNVSFGYPMVTRLSFSHQGLKCYKLHHEISEAVDVLATLGDQF